MTRLRWKTRTGTIYHRRCAGSLNAAGSRKRKNGLPMPQLSTGAGLPKQATGVEERPGMAHAPARFKIRYNRCLESLKNRPFLKLLLDMDGSRRLPLLCRQSRVRPDPPAPASFPLLTHPARRTLLVTVQWHSRIVESSRNLPLLPLTHPRNVPQLDQLHHPSPRICVLEQLPRDRVLVMTMVPPKRPRPQQARAMTGRPNSASVFQVCPDLRWRQRSKSRKSLA